MSHFVQECKRRERLRSHLNDLLSMVEQNLPILSEKEIRMKSTLKTCETQMNVFKENLVHLKRFLSIDHQSSSNAQNNPNVTHSLQTIQEQIHNAKIQLDLIKDRLKHIH